MRTVIVRALAISSAMFLALLSACAPQTRAFSIAGAATSAPGETVWFAEQRAGLSESEVFVVMCRPQGRPPCIRFRAADANADEMRQWIEASNGPAE